MNDNSSNNDDLMYLPKTNDKWYYARRRLPVWVSDDDEDGEVTYSLPWLTIVMDIKSRMLLNLDMSSLQPHADDIIDNLLEVMKKPMIPELNPIRPSEIHFEQKDIAEAVRPVLQGYGISAFHRPSQGYVNHIVSELREKFESEGDVPLEGLLQMPGVSPSLAGHFYEAAAEFFLAEPWIWLSNYDVLKIQVGPKGPARFAVVMGLAGMDYGLSVHQSWKEIEDLYLNDDPEGGLPRSGRHVLMYNEAPVIAIDDLLEVSKYGWQVLTTDFFPTPVIITKRGFSRPEADMLQWYEAVLKALVIFVKEQLVTHPDGSHPPVTASIEVNTSKGKMSVLIEYPGGDLSKLWMPVPPQRVMPEDLDGQKSTPGLPAFFDMRSLERQMFSMVKSIDDYQPIWPLEVSIAQEIVYDAWEESDPVEQVQMAKAALRVSPDCGDAYVILAEAAASYAEALELYQKGIEAARRALGEGFFLDEENLQHFWGILETRPLLRCLEGKAISQEKLKRWQEAEETYRYILEINPNDNQGIRYMLLYLLFERGKFEEAALFMKQFKNDPGIEWIYCRPLLDFRMKGPQKAVGRALRKAIKYNAYVPKFLLSRKRVPSRDIVSFSPGGMDEAVLYAGRYLNHWRRIPGAVAWLKSVFEEYSDRDV